MEGTAYWKMPAYVGEEFTAKVMRLCGDNRDLAVSLAGEESVRRHEERVAEDKRLENCRQRLRDISDRVFSAGHLSGQDAEALLAKIENLVEGSTRKNSARQPAPL